MEAPYMKDVTPSRQTSPEISAVLVSWNRKDLIVKAVESLLEQNYPALEIIVVDNGSTDGSQDLLRNLPEVQLIENKRNIGASAARNQGTRLARGDYIVYMDSDAELRTPGTLSTLVQYMEDNPDTAGASGIFFKDPELTELWCWSPCMDWEGNHDLQASLSQKPNPPVLTTCFVIFRHHALKEIGGFDEFFFYLYEDADVCYRLRKRGYRLYVDPKIQIFHHFAEPGRTRRGKIRYHYYHEKLRTYFVLKNWGTSRFLISWWKKVRNPLAFRRQFPYLPIICYVDIYWVRCVLLFLAYPYIRRRRYQKWI
jgi:GT2 family glycosyltransferase